MSALMSLLSDVLYRYIARSFEEEKVKTVLIGSNTKVFLDDGYVELVKGSEYYLPRWIAARLEEEKHASIPDEIDDRTLATLSFSEEVKLTQEDSVKFRELKGFFYQHVKWKIQRMLEEYRKELIKDPKALTGKSETIRRMTENLEDLANKRRKRMIIALNAPFTPKMLENLSEEEKLFYTSVRSFIEEYYNKVLKVGGSTG